MEEPARRSRYRSNLAASPLIPGEIPAQASPLTSKINRQDFGVSFGVVTETGSILLGDEVKITASVQFVKQAVAELALAV